MRRARPHRLVAIAVVLGASACGGSELPAADEPSPAATAAAPAPATSTTALEDVLIRCRSGLHPLLRNDCDLGMSVADARRAFAAELGAPHSHAMGTSMWSRMQGEVCEDLSLGSDAPLTGEDDDGAPATLSIKTFQRADGASWAACSSLATRPAPRP